MLSLPLKCIYNLQRSTELPVCSDTILKIHFNSCYHVDPKSAYSSSYGHYIFRPGYTVVIVYIYIPTQILRGIFTLIIKGANEWPQTKEVQVIWIL